MDNLSAGQNLKEEKELGINGAFPLFLREPEHGT